MHLPSLFTALALTTVSQAFSIPGFFPSPKSHNKSNTNNHDGGHAIITNSCSFPIYLWSVGASAGPQMPIKPARNHIEPYRHDETTNGVALKITAEKNGLYNNAPQLILAYDLDLNADRLYYDLSEKFGSPFQGRQVKLFAEGVAEDQQAETVVVWEDGVAPPGLNVLVLDPSRDLNLTIC